MCQHLQDLDQAGDIQYQMLILDIHGQAVRAWHRAVGDACIVCRASWDVSVYPIRKSLASCSDMNMTRSPKIIKNGESNVAKYWGGDCTMGFPPSKILGGYVPPPSSRRWRLWVYPSETFARMTAEIENHLLINAEVVWKHSTFGKLRVHHLGVLTHFVQFVVNFYVRCYHSDEGFT